MPPATDLTELTAAISKGFADVVAAIESSQSGVDLAPLTQQVQLVVEALYTGAGTSITQVAEESNQQVSTVLGMDNAGDMRVRVNPDMPA